MASFIYCPKSGSRVITTLAHADVCYFQWQNGCVHISGAVELLYATSVPGSWWRSEASNLAKKLAAGTGGIAADAQGTVSLFVQPEAATKMDEIMRMARGGSRLSPKERDEEDSQNMVRMLAMPCFSYEWDGFLGRARYSKSLERPIATVFREYKDHVDAAGQVCKRQVITIINDEGDTVDAVTAPDGWRVTASCHQIRDHGAMDTPGWDVQIPVEEGKAILIAAGFGSQSIEYYISRHPGSFSGDTMSPRQLYITSECESARKAAALLAATKDREGVVAS